MTWTALNANNAMRKRVNKYLAGICQAAVAALLASAVIVPKNAFQSILWAMVFVIAGLVFTILEEDK